MAQYMRVVGRVLGRAAKSQAFDRALTVTAAYVVSELKLSDLRMKRSILRRKKQDHLHLLGKTVYRLVRNDIDPLIHDRVRDIMTVLDQINAEIHTVSEELSRRRREYHSRAGTRTKTGTDAGSRGHTHTRDTTP